MKGELARLKREIEQLQDDYPNLQPFVVEQLREELLAIEATTYAGLIRAGHLNQELAPLLQTVLANDRDQS